MLFKTSDPYDPFSPFGGAKKARYILGPELLSNGNMESGDPPTAWTAANGGVTSGAADERPGGVGVQSLRVTNSAADTGRATQIIVIPASTWLLVSGYLRNGTGGAELYVANINNNTPIMTVNGLGGGWVGPLYLSGITDGNITVICKVTTSTVGHTGQWDDLSVRAIDNRSLFTTPASVIGDLTISADVTIYGWLGVSPKLQAGVFCSLDSLSLPRNYVSAYVDGTRAHLIKVVNGLYSNVISAVVAYAAGKTISIVKSGTTYQLFYDGTQVGVDSTIADAGIVNNTWCGKFSTYPGNLVDNLDTA